MFFYIYLYIIEEKAMYSSELEKHKREKEDWKKRAERAEEQASALKVNIAPNLVSGFQTY